jgi:adenylate cyclase
MEQKGFHRKLTAILSADVAGYSRLMQDDEAATVKTLEAYKQIISDLVKQHRGRVVDSPGDNLLAEFASVVDAVQCAVATQKELQARNTELPENRKMQFRIGVNLGDVIEEESRIYGDGVNIAARLESLADPGGICVSKTAFDQIETKLPFGYEYLGEQSVKNIAKAVGAYRVLMEPRVTRGKGSGVKVLGARRRMAVIGLAAVLAVIAGAALWQFYIRPAAPPVEKADAKQMALPLPELPSIAVLPFTNMSEDPKQEFLCDGITENIITALSKVPRLFVIARNSTFAYKGKPVKVKQVSEELGVQYVLEGSVQRSADRIRINAQLIDALKGHHIWAERYDFDLKDLFALQDDITIKILNAIRVKLTEGVSSWFEKHTGDKQDLDCLLKCMEAQGHVQRANIEDNNVARRIAEEAIAMCPEPQKPYSLMAAIHMMDYWFGTSKSPKDSIEKAIELAQKSLAVDDTRAEVHALLGQLYCLGKKWDEAIAEGERGIALNPSGADVKYWYAATLTYAGRPEEAILLFEKAIRLNPFGPSRYFLNYGHALRNTGRFDEALSAYKKALQREPNNFFGHLQLAATYSMLGREKDAQAETAEVLRLNPKFTLDYFAKVSAYKDRAETDKVINALRKTGLPDKPPLPLPEKPSIAVLPFNNMSDDPQQEYFSDGISEDIITDLSKISGLIVIARNSSFSYKGKPVNVQQIGQDLGVRYLLEGSVRKAGDQMRINAQLIDASNGQHLWAERYDGKSDDVFALQDKITHKIISALALKLTASEQKALTDKGTDNLQAYDEFLKGWQGYRLLTNAGFAEAKIHLEKAVELDPEFARANAALAVLYWKAVQTAAPGLRQGLGLTNHAALDAVRTKPLLLLKKAMRKPTALAHGLMSQVYLYRYLHGEALSEIERAVAMDPNDPELYAWMSTILWFMGKNREAIESAKMGQRLDPNNPAEYLNQLAKAYLPDGNIQESLQLLERVIRLNPELSGSVALSQAMIYGIQGRNEEARTAYEIFLKSRMTPVRSLKDIMPYFPFADAKQLDSFAAALIKAGVPGTLADNYRISRENRLNGQEVKSLLFGRKITGISMITGKQFLWEFVKSGEWKFISGDFQNSGKSWVEENVFFSQSEKLFGGLPYGATIFRNPDGSRENKNEYYMVNDLRGITPFAPTE